MKYGNFQQGVPSGLSNFRVNCFITQEGFEPKQVGRVVDAGAVFIGPWTPEPLGDYIAHATAIDIRMKIVDSRSYVRYM